MSSRRRWRYTALAVAGAVLVPALVTTAFATTAPSPQTQAPATQAGAPGISPADRRLAQDLARSILAGLPATAARGAECDPATLESLRMVVTATIAKTNPSRAVAIAAIAIAQQQAAPGDPCRTTALDDTATELDGQGVTVDDAGKMRGFTLYMGPLPPSAHRVQP